MLSSLALALTLGSTPLAAHPVSASADTIRTEQEIRQVVLRNAADVRRCYEIEGLRRNPELTGLLEIRITILPTGRVDDVALATSSMSGRGVEEVVRCIARVARHWRFERGAFSVESIVLPFTLTPAAAEPRAPEWWA
jgi:hypothetical protein